MNRVHLGAGLLLLLIGIMVYLMGRPAGAAPGILAPFNIFHVTSDVRLWGVLAHSLPTLTHTAAFILLTTALLDCRPGVGAVVATLWLLLEALFELGQHEMLSASFASAVPAWWEALPGFRGTRDYFLRGSFDPLDLASIALGALVAYFIVSVDYRRRHNGDCDRS